MDRPKVGVGVIVLHDGKVLLQQRINTHGHGTWSFPGGHLEFGESLEACAVRETAEELGIEIKNLRPVTFTNDVFHDEGKHYVTIYVLAEYAAGTISIRESEKTKQWGWFSWDELPEPLFLPIQNLLKQGYSP